MLGSLRLYEGPPVLSYYMELPVENLDYETFKEQTTIRLLNLRRVENNSTIASTINTMKDDLITHSCLRLVCCATSRWQTVWFVNSETRLFQRRLESNKYDPEQFFLYNIWPHLHLEEFNGEVRIGYTTNFDPTYCHSHVFDWDIKIHFSKCSEALAKRMFKLEEGYLQFSKEILILFLVSEFRKFLTSKVDVLYDQLTNEPDERLERLSKDIFAQTQQTIKQVKDVLNKENLFPPCMKGIMEQFKKQRHLKYNDRQALCLYLKNIGMPINDTIQFFRTNFNVPPDVFNKEYLYAIRHNYGLEGKRANYQSFTCQKLIKLSMDSHSFGCPFSSNHEFRNKYTDIEDLGVNPLTCCAEFGAQTTGKVFNEPFSTPVEYFKLAEKTTSINDAES